MYIDLLCLKIQKIITLLTGYHVEPQGNGELQSIIDREIEASRYISPQVKSLMMKASDGGFYCGVCEAPFTVNSNLRVHVESKHCRQEYNCPFCAKKFYIRNSYVAHLKKHAVSGPESLL